MKTITYILQCIVSNLLSLFMIVGGAFIIALFVQPSGYLPSWLNWFQTPDNPATGDPNWNGGKVTYLNTVKWLIRNPAQGFDQSCKADVIFTDTCTFDGHWYRCNGYYEYSRAIPVGSMFMLVSFGWRLKNIYEQYPHPTQGQIIAWPVRFNKSAT